MIPRGSILEVISLVQPRHLLRRGRVGVFTAFLDESGTHGKVSRNTVMAGFVGHESEWVVFENGWQKLLERNPEIETVHGRHLIPRRGFYHRWPDEKYWQFIVEIAGIMRSSQLLAMMVTIDNAGYMEYRKRLISGKRRYDSAYGMCFRYCLTKWSRMLALANQANQTDERLSFVVELGHKNAGDAVRIFQEAKQRVSRT